MIDWTLLANQLANLRSAARLSLVLAAAVILAGCAARPEEIGREPVMSPVGSGISQLEWPVEVHEAQWDGGLKDGQFSPAHYQQGITTGSLWHDRGGDLFRDARARRPGDILTVTISIKDKASLDNSSKRSRDSEHGMGVDFSHAIALPGWTTSGTASAQSAISSNTSTDGKGEIARSESIDLRVAAVVTGVLPNGNLIISGSQELRVNYELRVLNVSGIVSITDIRADNTIAYDRIAEARMSYGGRGRSMEVQQPGWLHQITDLVAPF